ncbi:MAG TPA: prepilin peptidase [Eubacteriaceae bacterium]|nr:prepilin peptidase [Eubacteriaceae bacterium]
MELYASNVVFLLGLIIGSFLNVAIARIPKNQSVAYPPSHCPLCEHSLKPIDLIPLFSFLLLKGRCRYCGAPISPRYPLVEAINAFLFLAVVWRFGLEWSILVYFIVVSALVVASFIDLKYLMIPDRIHVLLIVTFVVGNLMFQMIPWTDALLGALVGSIPLFLVVLLTGGSGMGMGDVKLAFSLGWYLGMGGSLMMLFFSFIYGALISVFLLASKIKTKKDPIPFGPFIALAFLTVLFWYELLFYWYLGLIV